MEEKNTILNNYAASLIGMVTGFANTVTNLNDNVSENTATIKTLNILLDSVRSQVVIIQAELDSYGV